MGKTIKGKDKAAAKVAAAKRKVERKCKGGRKVAAMVALFAIALALSFLAGCATSDSAQPAKSQTQTNNIRDCFFVFAARCDYTNGAFRAEGGNLPAFEMLTQTQSLESSGTESFAQTATQTPTTDVKPDIDVKYNDAVAGATVTSRGVLESLGDIGREAVLKLMADKTTGTVEVQKKDGTTATVKCEGGQCSFCTDCTP